MNYIHHPKQPPRDPEIAWSQAYDWNKEESRDDTARYGTCLFWLEAGKKRYFSATAMEIAW